MVEIVLLPTSYEWRDADFGFNTDSYVHPPAITILTSNAYSNAF